MLDGRYHDVTCTLRRRAAGLLRRQPARTFRGGSSSYAATPASAMSSRASSVAARRVELCGCWCWWRRELRGYTAFFLRARTAMAIRCSQLARAFAAVTLVVACVTAGAPPSASLIAQGDANQVVPLNAYKDLKWRMVGASRGGRVTGMAGVRQQPHTFYAGATGGGVWKTEDAGITWYPIGDGQITTGSIGSIDVAPSNPDHVWVGTGSAAIRSNVIIGRGIFKSTDAGKSFQFAGLRESGQVGGMRVHPTNPDIGLGGGLGHAVRSERRARHLQDRATAARPGRRRCSSTTSMAARDIEVDWQNPDVLYAAMYRGFRKGWDIISGGPADKGGIYKSVDGGETWKKIVRRPAGEADRQDRSRHRAQQPQGALRDDRSAGQRRRALPVERRRRDRGRSSTAASGCGRGPSTSTTSASTRRTRTRSSSASSASTSRSTAARRSRRSQRRTATTTASGSIPTTPTSCCRSTTAAPTSR